jgi:hypothetical protein
VDPHRSTSRRILILATTASLLVAGLALPSAATSFIVATRQPASASQQEVPEGFEPVGNLPPQEHLPAAPLLIAAYAFAWVMILGYVWLVWRRIGAVRNELADVERRLEEARRR